MLVVSRKQGEEIVITGPDGIRIQVTVCEFRGDKVRLGISGPQSYSIHRLEVQQAIDRQSNSGLSEP